MLRPQRRFRSASARNVRASRASRLAAPWAGRVLRSGCDSHCAASGRPDRGDTPRYARRRRRPSQWPRTSGGPIDSQPLVSGDHSASGVDLTGLACDSQFKRRGMNVYLAQPKRAAPMSGGTISVLNGLRPLARSLLSWCRARSPESSHRPSRHNRRLTFRRAAAPRVKGPP